jgi:Tol biopolymer transport system component
MITPIMTGSYQYGERTYAMYRKLVLVIISLIMLYGIIWGKTDTVKNPNHTQFKILYTETFNDTTTVWRAQAGNLLKRRALVRVNHRDGYPIKASLSPDRTEIAYTLLPSDGRDPSLNGSLWVVNIENAKNRNLDDSIDYHIVPRWSPDNQSIVYLKTYLSANQNEYRTELYSSTTDGLDRKLLLADNIALGINPIGYSPNGRLFYYARIAPAGDDLWSVNIASSAERFITHISEGAAWNLNLSPNGKEILGSIIENRRSASYAVISLSTDGKKNRNVWTRGAQRHYTPIWGPDSYSITTNFPKGGYPVSPYNYQYQGELKILNELTNTTISLSSSYEWMDVPVSWSPDKKWLVFERYHDSVVDYYVMNYEVSISYPISSVGWVQFVGWSF